MGKTIYNIALEIGSGLTPLRSNDQYWNSRDFPWVKTEQLGAYQIFDANEYVSETALRETSIKVWPTKTVSIAMYGEGKTRGNSSILMIPSTTNQACCNIVVDPQKADYRFLYYWLKNNYEQLRSLAAGVRKNLNADDIKGFPFPDFEVGYQSRIADALSAVDDLIENNSKLCESLESMEKTLYGYWFTQFDFPNAEGKPYRTSGGAMEWNEQLKREIPKGWNSCKLKDYVDSITQTTPPGENLNGMFYTPIDEIPKRQMSFYGGLSYTEAKSSLQLYEENDILIGAMRVYFHRVCIAAQNGITRSTTMVLRPKDNWQLAFIYEVFNHEQTIQFANRISVGTQQPYVNWEGALDSMEVISPNQQIVKEYCERVNPIINKVKCLAKENYELAKLRDWLLPMLMNGQAVVE